MRRVLRVGLLLLVLLGALMVVVTVTPLVRWWAIRLASPWEDSRGDTLIVLSGSSGGDGIIGYGTYLRCEYAVRAWREGGFRSVVVTGGSKTGEAEAIPMKNFLVAEGVPESVIVLETRANSTRENALYTKDLLHGGGGT
ncbi:MAG TPA: YdcF family protein, partial [Terriglobales bacterium]|nr:YdcF family protein [Terriglobales bacterium]